MGKDGGVLAIKSIIPGTLTLGTTGLDQGYIYQNVPEFDNDTGSAIEVKLRLLEGPTMDVNGAIFTLSDGKYEGKISFFNDHISILDQNHVKSLYWMDTTTDYHIYRIAIFKDTMKVYVDNVEVSSINLSVVYLVSNPNH